VAEHLGVPVWAVRVVFIAAALAGGGGVLAYALLWAFVPQDEALRAQRPEVRMTSRPRSVLISLAALAVGVLLIVNPGHAGLASGWGIAAMAMGAALVWVRIDEEQRARLLADVESRPRGWVGFVQVLIGVVLMGAGTLALVSDGRSWQQVMGVASAALVLLSGLALLIAPFAIRTYRERDGERQERIRAQERAELAARIHDSVLQTLTLIQRHSDQPREVTRLARAQQRDLRRVLYESPTATDQTFRRRLHDTAADVEDTFGVSIEAVCVGDGTIAPAGEALLLAAREAMVNAARHTTGSPVASVYAEVSEDAVVVYVRDRGCGFDPDQVPADRLGVRESIIGRMQRVGGEATIRSGSDGTEVVLHLGAVPDVDPGTA